MLWTSGEWKYLRYFIGRRKINVSDFILQSGLPGLASCKCRARASFALPVAPRFAFRFFNSATRRKEKEKKSQQIFHHKNTQRHIFIAYFFNKRAFATRSGANI
jgi:hypothetical protein